MAVRDTVMMFSPI